MCTSFKRKKTHLGFAHVKHYDYPLVFLGLFFYKSLNLFKYNFPWAGDSILTIAGGMFFAGYDWSQFAAGNSYYGFLFPMLLSPLMKLITNPTMLYKTMLFISDIVMSINGVLIYHIANKLQKEKKYSAVIVCAYMLYEPVAIFSDFILSEVPFLLWVLVLTIIILNLTSDDDSRIKNSIVLFFLLPVGILIHARCLIVWVSIFVTIICYHIIYRKALVYYPAFLVFPIIYYVSRKLVNYIQANIWMSSDASTVTNSVENVSTKFFNSILLSSASDIIHFLELANSIIFFEIYLSGGVLLLALFSVVFLIKSQMIVKNSQLFTICSLGIISYGGMVAAQAITQFNTVAQGKDLKMLVYVRYSAPFCVFLYFSLAFFLNEYHKTAGKLSFLTLLIISLYSAYYYQYWNNKFAGQFIYSSTLFYPLLVWGWTYKSSFSGNIEILTSDISYSICFLLTVTSLFGTIAYVFKKRALLIMLIFSAVVSFRTSYYYENLCERQYKSAIDTVNLVRSSDPLGQIAVFGNGEYIAELRYGLFDYDFDILESLEPESIYDYDVIFSSKEIKEYASYYKKDIADSQYAYTKSQATYDRLINSDS